MRAALPDDIRLGLKASVRRAIDQLGGLKAAAHAARLSLSSMQRLGDATAPEMAAAGQLAFLAAAGATAPAEFLAGLAGGRFVAGAEPAECLLAASREAIAESSELIWRLSEASADRVFSAGERRDIERALADHEEALARLKGALRRPRKGGGGR